VVAIAWLNVKKREGYLMSEQGKSEHYADGCDGVESDGKNVSRRDFLKIAGAAGAVVGAGAGMAGLLAACGGSTSTSTTGAASSTTGATSGSTTTAAVATTAAQVSTTVGATAGRALKIGFVTPLTGALATFGIPDQYCVDRWKEAVADGLVCGDGQKHPVTIIVKDSQSDSNRAAQVAGDLIQNDKVDMVTAASTGDVVVPVADQCEAQGMPCWTSDNPWEAFFFGRKGDPKVGFKWTYHTFFGFGDWLAMFMEVWTQLPTNKVIGWLSANTVDGNTAAQQLPPVIEKAGYKVYDGGRYQPGNEDFTSIISMYKKAGTEIIMGPVAPPGDFTNFWKQSIQQGLVPVMATIGAALLFPESVQALGELGYGVCPEVWWHATFPFKSSLTGETCQQLADDYEKRTKRQWTQPLLHYVVFELAADAFKRTKSVDDKQAIIDAVKTTKLDTIAGPIDLTSADPNLHPVPNVCTTQIAAGQWVKGTKWPYEVVVIGNAKAPSVKVQAKLQPLSAFPAYAKK
jgi:branched-chain amino acid transport system substrate-binding protein